MSEGCLRDLVDVLIYESEVLDRIMSQREREISGFCKSIATDTV